MASSRTWLRAERDIWQALGRPIGAATAYIASPPQCEELCSFIWLGFDALDPDGGLFATSTEEDLSARVLPRRAFILNLSSRPRRLFGKTRSMRLPSPARSRRPGATPPLPLGPRPCPWRGSMAHFTSRQPRTAHTAPLFSISLRRRLRIPIWDALHLVWRSHRQNGGTTLFLASAVVTVSPALTWSGAWSSQQHATNRVSSLRFRNQASSPPAPAKTVTDHPTLTHLTVTAAALRV